MNFIMNLIYVVQLKIFCIGIKYVLFYQRNNSVRQSQARERNWIYAVEILAYHELE